jgi:hypothetical protein
VTPGIPPAPPVVRRAWFSKDDLPEVPFGW